MILETILAPLLSQLGGALIDRIFPDQVGRDKAKLELLKLQQQGIIQEIIATSKVDAAQLRVNEAEAKSNSLFKSGWRPFVAWSCALAFVIPSFMPWLVWVGAAAGLASIPALPVIDTQLHMQILIGLLGLATARSFDKWKIKE